MTNSSILSTVIVKINGGNGMGCVMSEVEVLIKSHVPAKFQSAVSTKVPSDSLEFDTSEVDI